MHQTFIYSISGGSQTLTDALSAATVNRFGSIRTASHPFCRWSGIHLPEALPEGQPVVIDPPETSDRHFLNVIPALATHSNHA